MLQESLILKDSFRTPKEFLLLLNPETSNELRSLSNIQKLRKKFLKKIFKKNSNHQEILKFFNQNYKYEFNNIKDFLNYSFKEKFELQKKINLKLTDNNDLSPSKFTKKLMNLFDNQDLKFISIIIHGSQGDGFITNYSDVDATVIIHNELISNLDDFNEISHQISKLNNQIKIYDPLSHHNVFLTLSSDLDCYPESFMPIKVLNDGKKLMNKEVLFNATRFDLDLKIESFINLVSRIIKITNNKKTHSPYLFKELISSYFMLIILEYEIITGEYSDKKTIFSSKIYNYKDKKDLKMFMLASKIRQDWPLNEYKNVNISSSFLELLLSDIKIMYSNIQKPAILNQVSNIFLK